MEEVERTETHPSAEVTHRFESLLPSPEHTLRPISASNNPVPMVLMFLVSTLCRHKMMSSCHWRRCRGCFRARERSLRRTQHRSTAQGLKRSGCKTGS